MALPVVTFGPAQITKSLKSFIEFVSSDAVPVTTALSCDLVDYGGDVKVDELKFPGTDGKIRPLRRDQTEESENFKVKCYDLGKVKVILGGMNGFKVGKATLWITDPTDASGKTRWKTDQFDCTVQRDGNIKFGEEYSSATLLFTSTKPSAVVFTENADV